MTNLQDYTLEQALEDHQAFFYFTGFFRKKPVVWHIHLTNQSVIPDNSKNRQYIKVFPSEKSGHMGAEIYLKISKIQPPDILKTIIMISQYKQLNIGTHYYGSSD